MDHGTDDAGTSSHRLFVFNGGFLDKRVKRILELKGLPPHIGWPNADDTIGLWGHSPTSWRGNKVAKKTGAKRLWVEDAFLRSVRPGRAGDPPQGLLIDRSGIHFDPRAPSDLENLLATHPLDDPSLLKRADDAIEWMQRAEISKYNNFDPTLPHPDPGYVLIIDQTRGDASVTLSGADASTFQAMLATARHEHPDKVIIIKTHPETRGGFRPGYLGDVDQDGRKRILTSALSPVRLIAGAAAVYVVSSQLGFEAILAGKRPVLFGQPFYAGWGLSDDRNPTARRGRSLSATQLFAAAMILYPVWYDPFRDDMCEIETVLANLEAQSRAWRQDRFGWTASGMSLWKRKPLQQVFGKYKPVIFHNPVTNQKPEDITRRHMTWASKPNAAQADYRLEDGFLRSRGLGAELVPSLSLILDDLGIYFDPRSESRLERGIKESRNLPPSALRRAEALRDALIKLRISKYNVGRDVAVEVAARGRKILVPGQVEDDASIRTGTQIVSTNLALLERCRAANPDAHIIYKPHPDVEAGLRPGALHMPGMYADAVLHETDAITAIEQVDEVWTMTSLLGFEALMRGKSVTCLGSPFYAGWGLTRDLGDIPDRRDVDVSLTQLIHACLIDYPRYFDPLTGEACPVEVVVERLANNDIPGPGPFNRATAKLQGYFSNYAHLWRR